MNYSITNSVRGEVIAAVLLALDYLKALLFRGRTTISSSLSLSFVLSILAAIVSSLFVTLRLRGAFRKRLQHQQQHQQAEEEIQHSSRMKNPLQRGINNYNGNNNNKNENKNKNNGNNSNSNNARVTDKYSSERRDEFFSSLRDSKQEDFDADGHVQMLLKHFRSSATAV
ncbi:uncharacterized protein TM35_000073270 [Trypanosoma theileri]|uniref:Uncharacterized protein n=1 Tax=Trypanosoma theileri TaxID=67003 RepID=A0A1X0P2I1_9TRYP|nr:uncharacterized protein TM35_000073270 [Trypanosoma theileri]ORC90903.1 hypothetical protein TM35_000073270 [Trypanosoma theileri]